MNDDWRLHGQDRWLMGKTFSICCFVKQSDKLDHEHCEFCWAKLSEGDGDLHRGCCTGPDDEGRFFWVCPTCFQDFRKEFRWQFSENEKA